MSLSRRSMLGVAALGVAPAEVLAEPSATGAVEPEVARLIDQSRDANAALMRGDIEAYQSLVRLADNFTLMSPFGGPPTLGALPPERMAAMGRFFRNGTLTQELVSAYGTRDMVVLAVIERANVEVGGLPAQDWALRVTLVYRREADGWKLAHRHADPLVESVSLAQAAALGRGERAP